MAPSRALIAMYLTSHHCCQTPAARKISQPSTDKQGFGRRHHKLQRMNIPTPIPTHFPFRRLPPLCRNQHHRRRLPLALHRIQTLLPLYHLTPRAVLTPHSPNNTFRQALRPRPRSNLQLITPRRSLTLPICPHLQTQDLPHCRGVHSAQGKRCLLLLHFILPVRNNIIHKPQLPELCRDVLSTFRTQ